MVLPDGDEEGSPWAGHGRFLASTENIIRLFRKMDNLARSRITLLLLAVLIALRSLLTVTNR